MRARLPGHGKNGGGASTLSSLVAAVLLCTDYASAAITLDLSSPDSIKSAAKTIASGMMEYYTGMNPGDVPGNLPEPYYWWEAGAMFGAMIDYWYFTGDDTWNDITTQALLHQVGPDNDFMPPNQTKAEGNDDQAFWGMAAMSAAENKFPNPPEDQAQWLALAQAVVHTQIERWNNETCGGGLKWQIFTFNNGYNYKNTISNGCFFNLASRLAVYTGNQTYADWANTMWDWVSAIGLVDKDYNFFDGSDDKLNCSEINHVQWTYNAGTFLVGAANMYNLTDGSEIWAERLNGIIDRLSIFFKSGNIMWEMACENSGICNVDQRSFKAYLSRWMAATAVRAPFTYAKIKPLLEASAHAAVKTCTAGTNSNQCGMRWWQDSHDGSMGVGEQMSALEVVQSNLIDSVSGPATADSGGISLGDPNAGVDSKIDPEDLDSGPVSTGDRAGAAILTVAIALLCIGTAWWIIV